MTSSQYDALYKIANASLCKEAGFIDIGKRALGAVKAGGKAVGNVARAAGGKIAAAGKAVASAPKALGDRLTNAAGKAVGKVLTTQSVKDAVQQLSQNAGRTAATSAKDVVAGSVKGLGKKVGLAGAAAAVGIGGATYLGARAAGRDNQQRYR